MPDDPTPDGDDPHLNVPVGMFEDIEDLKAQMQRLTTQVETLREHADGGPREASEQPENTGEDESDESELGYPPFIFLLDSPAYEEELRALIEWVEGVLVPGYLAEPSHDNRWCYVWFEHPTGVVPRLHALWLAWQELTDPSTCGYTGPSVWHRDHLDPCMRELRAPTGPFQGCVKGEHQLTHRQPSLVPSAWCQAD